MRNKQFVKALCVMVSCAVLTLSAAPLQAQAAPRRSSTDLTYVKQVFDADYYFNNNSDVARVIGSDYNRLLDHYVTYGINEGRNASATFNATNYKNNYADLRKAFGTNIYDYVRHYVEYGISENRNAIDVLVAPEAVEETVSAESGTVIATYSTRFNARIARATNVKLAASQVNGKVLQPNETFSFLGSITPRTTENGYVMATVFSGGRETQGIGGGICQVSSTIYAAITSTSCTIVERHSHSLPVSYVPRGMDATVSAPSLDFRFTNTYDKPMLLTVTAGDDGVLTVTVSLQ